MILTYLLDNYIPFYTYLDYIETSKLYMISKKYMNCIPESYWYNCLLNNNSTQIIITPNYITIVHNPTHKTVIDRNISKNTFRYIAICNSK